MLRRSLPHVKSRASPLSCYAFTREGSLGEDGDAGAPGGEVVAARLLSAAPVVSALLRWSPLAVKRWSGA
jgi:hypothetical protein